MLLKLVQQQFSPAQSNELFYLCQVLGLKTATTDMCDYYNHAVAKDEKYLECQYYEKVQEKKGFIQYKLLKPIVFLLPHHVAMPSVTLSHYMKLMAAEYLFIADCC